MEDIAQKRLHFGSFSPNFSPDFKTLRSLPVGSLMGTGPLMEAKGPKLADSKNNWFIRNQGKLSLGTLMGFEPGMEAKKPKLTDSINNWYIKNLGKQTIIVL